VTVVEKKFNQFKELCKENEIIKQMTTTYILEQNKVAKWKKLTLVANAQCLINFANLPSSFWIETMSTTNYI
jgi:hypothetical protein